MIEDEDEMDEAEDCKCLICEFIRNTPAPRNRFERREQQMFVRRNMKYRHKFHIEYTPIEEEVDEDIDDVFDELEEEIDLNEEPLQQ